MSTTPTLDVWTTWGAAAASNCANRSATGLSCPTPITEAAAVVNFTNPYAGKCKWNSLNTGLTCSLVVTLLLNVFASVILFRVPLVTVRGRSNPVYLCIRFLNVSDVAQSILLLVMPAFADPDCVWLGGPICCSLMGFMALFLLLASPLITILMAFDRVIALYQPFKYRSHLGLKILKIMLPSACGFVFILTILPIFGVGEYHVVRGRRMCLLDTITDDIVDTVYVLVVHSIFLIALFFMAACTITFQVKLFRMSFDKKHKSVTRKRSSGRRTRNATITTMAVCLIFIICYLPYVVRVMYESSSGNRSATLLTWATFALAFLQPLLNPIVYVATNVRYRQELQVLLRNIKASELDSSTDSQNGNSRGAFSEFRRRISGKGRHGSHKNRGSRHSSIGSPLPAASSLDRRKNSFASCSKPESPDTNFLTHKPQIVEPRRTVAAVRREPSTSSGIKSYDSHEHLAAPQIRLRDKFGRLGRFSEEDPERLSPDISVFRQRSRTLSGISRDGSPGKGYALAAGVFCTSVPLLSAAPQSCPRSQPATEIRILAASPKQGRQAADSLDPDNSSKGLSAKHDVMCDAPRPGRLSSGSLAADECNLSDVFEDKPRHRDSGVVAGNESPGRAS